MLSVFISPVVISDDVVRLDEILLQLMLQLLPLILQLIRLVDIITIIITTTIFMVLSL